MKIVIKRILHYSSLTILMSLVFIIFIIGAENVFAKEQKSQYLIKVNRYHNTITVYEMDESGEYSVPVRAMVCSVGTGSRTILGTFQTKAKYRWKELMGDVYGQYSTRIVGGILFHSVYYYEYGNPATLASGEYNKLGTAASHGCIRLTVEDAKWIYDNCTVGTTVIIYDNKKEPGPLGKPESIKIPKTVRWDPTDPNENNPYKEKMPILTGVKNITINQGENINLLNGVKAKSTFGLDITKNISVLGEINTNTPGEYEITYNVTDSMGRTGRKTIKVTVKENVKEADPTYEAVQSELETSEKEEEQQEESVNSVESSKQEQSPANLDYSKAELIGVQDRVIKGDAVLDTTLALMGVEAHCSGHRLAKEDILVDFKNENNNYIVTYTVKGSTISKSAVFYVDNEAPIFFGVKDRMINSGEIPSTAYALIGVSVKDNYTSLYQKDIKVTIKELSDGDYKVTYEAKDEAGNIALAQVKFLD